MITGSITCLDSTNTASLTGSFTQQFIRCTDSTDNFNSAGFLISKTIWSATDTTVTQGQELSNQLGLTLLDRRYQGWTNIDGTFIDGTYTEPRLFNPISISYGLYKNSADGSSWELQGYRFREPIYQDVGRFSTNLVAPDAPGTYRVEWLVQKDASSDTTAINQTFSVVHWGTSAYVDQYHLVAADNTAPFDNTPRMTNEIFGEWVGNNWGTRWPQYLW